VAPALAGSVQQSSRILQQRTKEEADVDVIFERVDVAERRVVDAGRRTTVVHSSRTGAAKIIHRASLPESDRRHTSELAKVRDEVRLIEIIPRGAVA
jgi:hypothetical protein